MTNNRVLLCDDDEGIVDISTIVLRDKGYDVVAFTDSRRVQNAAETLQPAVILLDLWMPELSGDIVARGLKQNKITQHIPIIIFSASKDTEKIADNISADDFIFKPFDITELEQKVAKYIQ